MKKLLLIGTALALFSCEVAPAFATTSTVNPNVPAQGSSLSSSTLRANFLAAYNDITNLWASIASLSASLAPSATIDTTNASNISTGTLAAARVATLNQNTTGSAGSFTGNLAGDVTGTQGATAIGSSTVTSKTLTGFSASAGSVSASDSILTAFNKLVGNINGLVTGVSSVFSRTGAVTAQSGDYTVSQVTGAAPLASPTFTGTVNGSTAIWSGQNQALNFAATGNGADTLPVGTAGTRPGSPVVGMIRYSTTANAFEGYQGASPAWSALGGSGGSPAGSTGNIQTNAGSGAFGAWNATNPGGGNATRSLLYSDQYTAGQIDALSLNGAVPAPANDAAALLYEVSNALQVDPRFYGAVCNAKTATNASITTGGVLSIPGYTFSAADVGKTVSANAAGYMSLGLGTVKILSVNTGANTAQLSASPVTSASGNAWIVWGNDDTASFENAGAYAGQYRGSTVIVPDTCAVRELAMPQGVMLKGAAMTRNYYGSGNTTAPTARPILYCLATGLSDDTTHFCINVTNNQANAYVGFTLQGIVFPYAAGSGGLEQLTGIGTASNDTLWSDGFYMEHLTLSNLWVGMGGQYNTVNSGYITFQSYHNEFQNSAWGFRGQFEDSASMDDVFTGNFGNGAMDLENSGALRFSETRYEESPNNNDGPSVLINGGNTIHFEGSECQFNGGYCLELSGQWSNITWTGGFMEGNGVANASGNNAQIGLNGSAGAVGGLKLSNVQFSKNNYSEGGSTNYIFDGLTSGAFNPDIEVTGGIACTNAWNTAIANWEVSAPTKFKVDASDCPTIITGNSTLSIGTTGNVGIGTATANAGSILDLSASSSSLLLPIGTTGQEPSSPTAGMIRYNSTVPQYEGYISGAWKVLGGAVTWPTSGNIVVSNSSSSPAGLAETDGDCVVGAGGVWTAGSCAGTASINLGSSVTSTNPQITGDATSGFFTPAAKTVSIAVGGVEAERMLYTANAVNYLTVTPGATGVAPIFSSGGTDTNGAGLGLKFVGQNATVAGPGGGLTFLAGNGFSASNGNGGAISFTAGNSSSTGSYPSGGGLTFTAGNGTGNGDAGGAISFTSGSGNNSSGGSLSFTAGAVTTGDVNAASVTLTGGQSVGNAQGGGVILAGGNATASGSSSAVGGSITIKGGNNTGSSGFSNAGGGAVNLQGGTSLNGAGGAISLTAANGTLGNNAGGTVSLTAGNSAGTGGGASVGITSGNGGATGAGGNVVITSGNGGSTSGNSGNIVLQPGTVTSGTVGGVAIGTTTAAGALNVAGTIKTKGYTVSTLPAGTVGMRAYVTDQTTACPLAGAALTGSGLITCPVFYNGSAWVGD